MTHPTWTKVTACSGTEVYSPGFERVEQLHYVVHPPVGHPLATQIHISAEGADDTAQPIRAETKGSWAPPDLWEAVYCLRKLLG